MTDRHSDRFAPAQTVRHFASQLALTETLERAISFSPKKLEGVWEIPVIWNVRLRNSAGRAAWRQQHSEIRLWIELHPGLKKAGEEALRETFLHELGHLLSFLEWGIPQGCGHRQEWWEGMIRLGQRPWLQRFHSIKECLQRGNAETAVETEEALGL